MRLALQVTNEFGIPETIVRALKIQNAQYDSGPVDISVTTMIMPAQIATLRRKHKHEMVTDVSDSMWALLGSGIHYLLQLGATDNMVVEERLFMEIDGWRISGAIDCQEMVNQTEVDITDYKVTSSYGVLEKEPKPEWIAQLNLHALLLEANKAKRVRNLRICAIIRDWTAKKAKLDPSYPQAPIVLVRIPLWSKQEQIEYARARIQAHKEARAMDAFGEPVPECTTEERWVRGESWAVFKGKNKRATKVCKSLEEAEQLKSEGGEGYYIIYREGESTRCGYCGVSQFCAQFAAMQKDSADDRANPVSGEDEED